MKLLTNEQQEPYEIAILCYICKEKFENKYPEGKNYGKVGDHCHYAGEYAGTVQNICNFKKYSILKKLSVIFHIDLIMIIMKSQKKYFKDNLVVSEKGLKNTQPFQFQQKKIL